jgi:leucyl/phenylalanyl-tRNA--protein transferase
MYVLSPETLIKAYALGVFPMAEHRDDDRIFFVDPDHRGILPLENIHLPRSLKKKINQKPYRITVNRAFDQIIDGCREVSTDREDSWINPQIRQLYCALARLGFAHSVEAWDGDKLVGGLYGVALAGAFFGESMFSRATDASKITLIHLMARLVAGGFTLLDTQFTNPHLEQFGAIEIPREEFKTRLSEALAADARFPVDDDDSEMVHSFMQDRTMTS